MSTPQPARPDDQCSRHSSAGRPAAALAPLEPGGARLQPQDDGQGQGLAADQVFLDLEDAVAPIAKPERAQEHRRGAERGRLGRQGPHRPGQRLDDAVDLRRRRRGRRGRRRQPGRDHAAQGADRRPGRRAGPAADPDREGARATRWAGSASRPRSRTRSGLIERRRHRRREPAGGDDHLRPADFMAVDQHEVPGRRRAAAGVRRRRRLPLHPDADPHGGPGLRQAGHRRTVPADPRRRRLPPGRRPVGGARLRRQVGAAPGPDRRRQRGLQPAPGGLRPRREHPGRLRRTTPPRPAAAEAPSCWATR